MSKNEVNAKYDAAVEEIKNAILQSQYQASKGVNSIQLSLYFYIGKYVSDNSRNGFWGTGAIAYISERLKRQMPGLRGFSETSMKNMRTFYEEWSALNDPESKSSVVTDDLTDGDTGNAVKETSLQIRPLRLTILEGFSAEEFLAVPFTHHYTILSKVKEPQKRAYYIRLCAHEHLSVEGLKKAITNDEYAHKGALPNNFEDRIRSADMARKAVMAFKDEYFLDFINTEELGIRDAEDVDERVVENAIVHNIKEFIMTFGRDFAFVGKQYHLEVFGIDHFSDLLFFNRELNCLVAVELKAGTFKPSYLGQLTTYLRILDDKVKKPHENPSIGLVLCKSANKEYVEYVIQDYDKPMGVATYTLPEDMPEKLRNALPDIEDLKRILGKNNEE